MKDREARWDEERERLVADAKSATSGVARPPPRGAFSSVAPAPESAPAKELRKSREETARQDDRAEELENRVKVLTAQTPS